MGRIDWIGSDGKPGNALIFEENESVPLSKVLTFTRKDVQPFKVSASYQKDDFSYYPEKHIGDYIVGGIKTPSIIEDGKTNIKLKVKLRVDNHGQLVVPQAVQIDKQVVEVPVEKEEKKPTEDDKKEEKPAENAEKPAEEKPAK